MWIVIDLFITVFIYLIFPIGYQISYGRVSKKRGKKLALINSVVGCFIFIVIRLLVNGGEIGVINFAPAVFYYFIARLILIDKSIPDEEAPLVEKNIQNIKSDLAEKYFICSKCGMQIFTNEKKCSNCGDANPQYSAKKNKNSIDNSINVSKFPHNADSRSNSNSQNVSKHINFCELCEFVSWGVAVIAAVSYFINDIFFYICCVFLIIDIVFMKTKDNYKVIHFVRARRLLIPILTILIDGVLVMIPFLLIDLIFAFGEINGMGETNNNYDHYLYENQKKDEENQIKQKLTIQEETYVKHEVISNEKKVEDRCKNIINNSIFSNTKFNSDDFYLTECYLSKNYGWDEFVDDDKFRIFATNSLQVNDELFIPSKIQNKKAISVGKNGFANFHAENLIFGKGIKLVEPYAFKNCVFNRMFVPKSLKFFDENSFFNSEIKEIWFENGTKTIDLFSYHFLLSEENTFVIPASVTKIIPDDLNKWKFIIDENNESYKYESGCLIDINKSCIIKIFENDDLVIPNVKSICIEGPVAIYQDQLIIPEGVETIEKLELEFFGKEVGECDELTICLPASLQSISPACIEIFEIFNIRLNNKNPYYAIVNNKIVKKDKRN